VVAEVRSNTVMLVVVVDDSKSCTLTAGVEDMGLNGKHAQR
jgi:hypothetical protein